jgi:thioredoxin 1
MTAMHRILKVNSSDEFDVAIAHGLVICQFSAQWCEPCQTMESLVQAVSNSYPGIKFIVVDVDELYELCVQYGVGVAPTFFAFKDGIKLDEFVGGNEEKFEKFVGNLSKLLI